MATKKTTTKPKAVKKVVKKVVKKEVKEVKAVKKETKVTPKVDNLFAIVKLSGKQFKVMQGVKYTVDRMDLDKGEKFVSEDVLLYSDGTDVKVGKPTVKGAKVEFEVASHKKDSKLRVFKYKAKARYRKTMGHRALITKLLVKKISIS